MARVNREVVVPFEGGSLAGTLANVEEARKVVLFADESSAPGPRARQVAAALERQSLATLLLDLKTSAGEAANGHNGAHPPDIQLLARRLIAAIDWLASERGYVHGSIGCFGAGAGAAAALIAAAHRPHLVGAVVSGGGRSDLAGADVLAAVHAPTLLIIGDEDPDLADANRAARSQLRCESDLRVVHGAGPRFDQPGALAAVADLAGQWFNQQLETIWSRSVDQPANL